MADEPDKSEKTEDPSQKKLEEAHQKGDVAKSQEVTHWFMILATAIMFALLAPTTSNALLVSLKWIIENADKIDVSEAGFGPLAIDLMGTTITILLLPLGLMAVAGVAANLVQHRPVLSLDPIKPKLSKISPIAGFKRLFSLEALTNFAKGIAKLCVVGVGLFVVMWSELDRLDTMMTADPAMLMSIFQDLALKLILVTLLIVTIIALADLLYQRNRWWEKQKMTVKEVKDEYKQMEGDPQIKAKIRQIRQERSQRRMMANVPDATVVITNPTHLAVALKYDKDMAAPVCVAKGMDNVALRIRALAEENKVPIVENPPLARALHQSVDINDTIPTEHFKAVAQVIGYVMRLGQQKSWSSK